MATGAVRAVPVPWIATPRAQPVVALRRQATRRRRSRLQPVGMMQRPSASAALGQCRPPLRRGMARGGKNRLCRSPRRPAPRTDGFEREAGA